MQNVPSLSSLSDDGSYELSAGPSTPNGSPLFFPIQTGFVNEKHFAPLLPDSPLIDDLSKSSIHVQPQPARLPSIKNICFMGAGYVGKSLISLRLS